MSDRAPPTGPWTPSDGTDRSRDWDQEEADDFVGLTILAGVTYLAADQKTVKAQAQYYGRIVSADRLEGIEVACEGKWAGTTMRLPPSLRAIRPARLGEYRLRSTGETIENPDLTTTFSVVEGLKS